MIKATVDYWKEKLLYAALCFIVVSCCSFGRWATISIHERPTKIEVADMIDKSPHSYDADKKWIENKLLTIDSYNGKLSDVIDKNTNAINALRLEIAKLGVHQDEKSIN